MIKFEPCTSFIVDDRNGWDSYHTISFEAPGTRTDSYGDQSLFMSPILTHNVVYKNIVFNSYMNLLFYPQTVFYFTLLLPQKL